ncbi:MAG: hypothetical protein ACLUEU_10765 [Oscillospiraceae bacterium]
MTTYKYKGQSLSGARVSGVVRAYDEFEAVAKLRRHLCLHHQDRAGEGARGTRWISPSASGSSDHRSWRCSARSFPSFSPRG